MRIPLFVPKPARRPQLLFAFLERRMEQEGRFKLLVVLATWVVTGVIVAAIPWSRFLSRSILASARQAGRQAVGLPGSREEIDESWRRYRRLQIDQSRARAEQFFARAKPADQRMSRYAGLDSAHWHLRRANYDWTILLSSKVFESELAIDRLAFGRGWRRGKEPPGYRSSRSPELYRAVAIHGRP